MPGQLTDVTEVVTALGMLAPDLDLAFRHRPKELENVSDTTWQRLVDLLRTGAHRRDFEAAFANGRSFLHAEDGLRGRRPRRVEWKGPHRPPGDDVIPADLRVDRVYLISCKYLSRVLVNSGPPRLFDRLLTGEDRSTVHWFHETAAPEFQRLYSAALEHVDVPGLPPTAAELTREQQKALKGALSSRAWPPALREPWASLCHEVSVQTAARWRSAMPLPRQRLRLLWRMLRITTATYFVLGRDEQQHLRLRIDSAWDWSRSYELRAFEVSPRRAGQPEVGWRATIRSRADGVEHHVDGHVEIRWSHGRFCGVPESKVYLDTPHIDVPGHHLLR